jgi:O-methyltransferase involved in polyketide biosynthesis
MAENGSSFDLSGVCETALFTLFNRAIESWSDAPILIDKKAEELMDLIEPLLEKAAGRMARHYQ